MKHIRIAQIERPTISWNHQQTISRYGRMLVRNSMRPLYGRVIATDVPFPPYPFEIGEEPDAEMFDLFYNACESYKGGHDRGAVIAAIKKLGEEWRQAGLGMYGYDTSLRWLYERFTPAQLAPMYFECSRNRNLLKDGKSILKGAILSIVNDAPLAAMSLAGLLRQTR